MATTKKSTQEETKAKKTTTKKETTTKTAEKKTTKATTAKKTTEKKPAAKSAAKSTTKAATKTTAKKATTTAKKATTKAAAKPEVKEEKKKVTTKQVTTQGFSVNQNKNEVDDLLSILSVETDDTPKPAPKEKKTAEKPTAKTATKDKKDSKTQAATKKPKPAEIKRPERKEKKFTKEEKALYKRLEDAFSYVANLTMVMEERLLDKKAIPDLTLGEIHVLEVVDKEAVMPMTKIANELKITVGSLTTCVNRLVKKEYLFRERDAEDHRVMKISTTQKAKKVLKLHDRFHEDILYGILDGVTIRDATKVMTQVARTLENYYNPKEKNYEKPIDSKKKKNI